MPAPRAPTSFVTCGIPSCSICALPTCSAFARAVYHAAARIPRGRVATYGAVAAAAGSPRGARAAGAALSRNTLNNAAAAPRVPCHRVVRADGGVGGFYGGGGERKYEMLREEGISFREDGTVDPASVMTLSPLPQLRDC